MCVILIVCTWIIDLSAQAGKLCEKGTNNESYAKENTQECR